MEGRGEKKDKRGGGERGGGSKKKDKPDDSEKKAKKGGSRSAKKKGDQLVDRKDDAVARVPGKKKPQCAPRDVPCRENIEKMKGQGEKKDKRGGVERRGGSKKNKDKPDDSEKKVTDGGSRSAKKYDKASGCFNIYCCPRF